MTLMISPGLGECVATLKIFGVSFAYTYRLDGEAKGSTVFRIPEDAYKSQGQSPRDL